MKAKLRKNHLQKLTGFDGKFIRFSPSRLFGQRIRLFASSFWRLPARCNPLRRLPWVATAAGHRMGRRCKGFTLPSGLGASIRTSLTTSITSTYKRHSDRRNNKRSISISPTTNCRLSALWLQAQVSSSFHRSYKPPPRSPESRFPSRSDRSPPMRASVRNTRPQVRQHP